MLAKLAEYKTEFVNTYLAPDSQYQVKLQEYISAKKELLEARLEGAEGFALTLKESAVSAAETTLNLVKAGADTAIGILDLAINTAITTINTTIDSILTHVEIAQNEINAAISNAEIEVKAEFSSEYGAYISVKCWNGLKPETSEQPA